MNGKGYGSPLKISHVFPCHNSFSEAFHQQWKLKTNRLWQLLKTQSWNDGQLQAPVVMSLTTYTMIKACRNPPGCKTDKWIQLHAHPSLKYNNITLHSEKKPVQAAWVYVIGAIPSVTWSWGINTWVACSAGGSVSAKVPVCTSHKQLQMFSANLRDPQQFSVPKKWQQQFFTSGNESEMAPRRERNWEQSAAANWQQNHTPRLEVPQAWSAYIR